jgi:hypothetical protein
MFFGDQEVSERLERFCDKGWITPGHVMQADGLSAERLSVTEEISCRLQVGKLVSHFAVGANCMICDVVSS